MTNAAALLGTLPARVCIVGYPGSAKTGCCAALANAGYKIRMLDYDGNPEPLLLHLDKRALANVDIVRLEDPMRNANKCVEVKGIPTAFNDGLNLMKHWTYENPDGSTTDLGRSRDWGPDTVVVLDSLSSMGDASMNRSMKAMNRNTLSRTQQIWGSAMDDQDAFVKIMRGEGNRFHLIVLSHLKLIGPDDIKEKDDDTTKENKAKVSQIVPFRLFPWALGQKLSPRIGGRFPTLILAEAQERANTVKRVLVTQPRADLDLKVPAKGVEKTYPIETGLLSIFEALGHKAPGFGASVEEDAPPSTPTPDNGDLHD